MEAISQPLPKPIPMRTWAKDFRKEAKRLEREAAKLERRAALYRSIAERLTERR